MNDEEQPPRMIYRRENRENPTIFEPPPPAPELPPLTGEEIDERLGVLDRIGTRIITHHGKHCLTTPIVPNERMMSALADLEMDITVLLVKQEGVMDLYYTMAGKGWLPVWRKDGWPGVEKIIRRNVTLMEV